ncbi:Cof-type HAD-IIB family hydrolase [Actinoallomurus spadix]|uniref:HAD family hydrolase n=1 Tax=Actinoallomurus spadix TaxID=79912 RepID=A0ABN0VQR2_9ACTN|nr:Cof-type HAD-IIB family hydrolase [Actinoallomurus spadix]MCO5990737.1 Cof-type HAD-IIB family hydrolase [Actinoallomurus spadix]
MSCGIRLIAADLDGTLLPHARDPSAPGPAPSARVRAALRGVLDAGIHVVVATGRPGRQARRLTAGLGVHDLAVCANGAEIYDLRAGAVVRRSFLSAAGAREVIAQVRASMPEAVFAWEDSDGIGHETRWNTPFVEPPVEVGDPAGLLNRPIGKLLARHPDLGPAELAARVRAGGGAADGLTLTWSTGPILEILARGTSKGAALESLARRLGVAADEVMAIGDAPNDLSMLAFAGRAVATGDAPSAVRAAADLVTGPDDPDGVARVLERLLPWERSQGGSS